MAGGPMTRGGGGMSRYNARRRLCVVLGTESESRASELQTQPRHARPMVSLTHSYLILPLPIVARYHHCCPSLIVVAYSTEIRIFSNRFKP